MVGSPPRIARRSKDPLADPNALLRADLFQPYVKRLAALLDNCAKEGSPLKQIELDAALDGQPSRELRKLYATDSYAILGHTLLGPSLHIVW